MTDWMNATMLPSNTLAFLLVLLDAAIKGAVLLGVGYLAVKLMWRASAALRHMVLFLAMASLLALPALSALLPQWKVLPRWLNVPGSGSDALATNTESFRPSMDPGPASPRDAETALYPAAHGEGVFGDEVARATPSSAPMAPAVAGAAETSAAEPAERWSSRQLLNWVVPIWVFGVLVALAPLFLGGLSLWRRSRTAVRISGGPWNALLKELSGNLRLRRQVILLQADRQTMPLAWGVIRPKILLPCADNWSDERRRVVLLHELAHIKRRHCLAQLISHLACALHWFNPLAWVIRRRMVSEREQACDDLVLSAGLKSSSYADHLLKIASGLRAGWATGAAAIAMARPSKLEGRLLAILDSKRSRRTLTRVAMVITIVLLAGIVLPLATMHAAELRNPVQTDENGKPIVTHVLYIWGQPKDPTFTLEGRTYKKMADVVARIKQLMTVDPFPYIRVRINPPIPSAQPLVEELGKQCRKIGFINMEFKYDLTEPPEKVKEAVPNYASTLGYVPLNVLIEREMHGSYLDLETGRLISQPRHMVGAEEVRDWVATVGADVVRAFMGSQIVFLGMTAAAMDRDSWDNATAQGINEKVRLWSNAGFVPIFDKNERPITWGFRTREGSIGLLEVPKREGDKFALRYKLLRYGAAKARAPRKVLLPDMDESPVMLDLASGRLVPIPDVHERQLLPAIEELGRGDLIYDKYGKGPVLTFVRGTRTDKKLPTLADVPAPCAILSPPWPENFAVTTREGKRYAVTILKADNKGCELEYEPLPTPEPSAQPPAEASFGPVIDRVLNGVGLGNECLDLETSRLFSLPPGSRGYTQEAKALESWIDENEIDLIHDQYVQFGVLLGVKMNATKVAYEEWHDMNAAEALRLGRSMSSPSPKSAPVMLPIIELPVSYVFKKLDGNTGILQIVAFTEEPKGVRIRYKMVQGPEGSFGSEDFDKEIRGEKMARPLTSDERVLLDTLVKFARDMEVKYPYEKVRFRNPVLYHVRSETSIIQWAMYRIGRKTGCSESEVGYGSSRLADAQADYYLPDGTPLRSRWEPRGNGMHDIWVDMRQPGRSGKLVDLVSRSRYDDPDRLLTTREGKKRALVFYPIGDSAQGMIARFDKPLHVHGSTPGGAERQMTEEYAQLTWLLPPGFRDGAHLDVARMYRDMDY